MILRSLILLILLFSFQNSSDAIMSSGEDWHGMPGSKNLGIGTINPQAKLHLNGSFMLSNGSLSSGYVLKSDANGRGTWQDNSGGGIEWRDTSNLMRPYDSLGIQTVVIGGTNQSNSSIILDTDGSAVFNEQGNSVDLRIEGASDQNLIFVDGSTDRVGIGTNSPNEKLTVEGVFSLYDMGSGSSSSGYGKIISAGSTSGLRYLNDLGVTQKLNPVVWENGGSFVYSKENYDTKDLSLNNVDFYANGSSYFNVEDVFIKGTTDDNLFYLDTHAVSYKNNIGIGVETAYEQLTINGVLSLAELSSAPSNGNYLNVFYVNGSDLYQKDAFGTETQLSGKYVAGSNRELQFNDNGTFGASSNLTWLNNTKNGHHLNVNGDLIVGSSDILGYRFAKVPDSQIEYDGSKMYFQTGGWDSMTVSKSGNVGVGLDPQYALNYQLHVNGDAAKQSSTWTNSSDRRLKDILGDYDKGLDELCKLNAIEFNYKEGNVRGLPSNTLEIGYVAQEVDKVFPEAVSTIGDGYLDLNLHPISIALVNAIQDYHVEYETEVMELDKEITKLENEVSMLYRKLCKKKPELKLCR